MTQCVIRENNGLPPVEVRLEDYDMANTNLTIDMITNEVQRVAHEKLTFIKTINNQFDDSYGREGAKIGSVLRIRLPDQYSVTTGRAIVQQDSVEQSVTMTMATQKHVAMRFNSAEMFTDIDDFSRRKITPAVSVLISDIENDVLQGCTKKIYHQVGTANTAITNLTVPGQARAKLNQYLAPKDGDRSIQMDSVTMGGLVNGVAAYFAPNNAIAEQYREGFVQRTAMATYYENEKVWTQATGSDIVGALDTYTVVDGDTSATTTGFTGLTVGQVFTIADAYACHPETKAAYSHLQQFVVITASNTAPTFQPPIYFADTPRRNVVTSTGGVIAISTTAVLTGVGTASKNSVQSLMYHKDAFAFVTGELPLMAGADRCVRKTVEGISLRVWTDSDIRNDEQITRIDILYGYQVIRAAWACRMYGTET